MTLPIDHGTRTMRLLPPQTEEVVKRVQLLVRPARIRDVVRLEGRVLAEDGARVVPDVSVADEHLAVLVGVEVD